MRDPEIIVDRNEFDCRRYILKGDAIEYKSAKTSDGFGGMQRHILIPNKATVCDVYEKFVVVKFKDNHMNKWIVECVNRWNITKINNRKVGNNSGWFGNMIVRNKS